MINSECGSINHGRSGKASCNGHQMWCLCILIFSALGRKQNKWIQWTSILNELNLASDFHCRLLPSTSLIAHSLITKLHHFLSVWSTRIYLNWMFAANMYTRYTIRLCSLLRRLMDVAHYFKRLTTLQWSISITLVVLNFVNTFRDEYVKDKF